MSSGFFLTNWFFDGMKWLYESLLGNSIFLTILVSTVILRLLMLLPDIKQRKSAAAMQEIQPEIAALQEKYSSDPRKLQVEQSKLMKERGVSMFSGCLPLLLTLPLMFCFIAAFRYWGYEQNVKMLVEMDHNITVAAETGEPLEISEAFKNSKFLWVNNVWQADNGFVPVVMDANTFFSKATYNDIKKLDYYEENRAKLIEIGILYDEADGYATLTDEQKEAAFQTAKDKYYALTEPLRNTYSGHNNGWYLLPLLATGLQFLYAFFVMNKQNANTGNGGGATGKIMMYMMPAMSFFFCLSATSAFAIYWTLSSLIMLITNILLTSYFNKKKAANALNNGNG